MRLPVKILAAGAIAASIAGGIAGGVAALPMLRVAPVSSTAPAATAAPRTGLPFVLDRLTDNFTGPATEVLQVSGYTYVRVSVDGGDRWAVGLQKPIVVGDVISVRAFGAAHQFQSKKLQRSFADLWFGVLSKHTTASTSATTQEPT